MRVLFPFQGNILGGSHISALTLARHLPADMTAVVAVVEDGPLLPYIRSLGFDALRLPAVPVYSFGVGLLSEVWRALRFAVPLSLWLRRNKIDLVHTHEYDMNSLWPLACYLAGVRHIWHQRNYNDSRRMLIYAPFVRAYLTISQYCFSGLPPQIRARTRVIDNPVVPPVVGAGFSEQEEAAVQAELAARMPRRSSISGPYVGFIGHLEDKKRILFFLDVAKRLRDEWSGGRDLVFLVFGSLASEQADLAQERARQLGLEGQCLFMGVKTPIGPWLRQLSLLVAPAKNEGLGRAVIEAQMAGVPVLASRDGGHIELIDDRRTGFLEAVDDVDGFVARAAEILSAAPDDIERLTQTARLEATTRFGVEAHVQAVVALYRAISSS